MLKEIKEYGTRYSKNVAKSLFDSAKDTSESKYGNLFKAVTWTQNEINNGVIKDIRTMNSSSIKNSLKNMSIFKDTSLIMKNAMSDLKTGKFYNKAREEQLMEKQMNSMFAAEGDSDLSDFNFDDSDSSFDDIEKSSDKSLNKDLNAGFAATSATISNSVLTGSSYVGETIKGASKLQYTQMAQMQQISRIGFEGVNNHLKAIIDFNKSALKQHIDNSTKFYETTTNYLAEQNAILKEMVEIQREMYKGSQPQQAAKGGAYSDIFSGGFSMDGYLKHVKNNWDNSTVGSVWNMVQESGGLAAMLGGSPMKFISDGLISTLMGPQLSKSLARLNKTAGNVPLAALRKLQGQNGILGDFLNEIFGLEDIGKEKKQIDPSKFIKGPVAYNGVANKALIEVIPTYLRRIEAALTGEDERVWDPETGRWSTVKAAKNQYKGERNKEIAKAMAPLSRHLGAQANQMKFVNKSAKSSFYNDLNNVMMALYENNLNVGIFKFSNDGKKLINAKQYMKAFGVSDEDNMVAIAKMLNNVDNNTKMSAANNGYELKERLSNKVASLSNATGDIRNLQASGALKGKVNSIFNKSQGFLNDPRVSKAIIGTYNEIHAIRTMLQNGTPSKNTRANDDYYNKFVNGEKGLGRFTPENSNTSKTKSGGKKKGKKSGGLANLFFDGLISDVVPEGFEFDYDGFGEGAKKSYKEAKGKSFSKKMKNTKGKMAKAELAVGALLELRDRPAAILADMVDAVNGSIESFFFDHEANLKDKNGKPIKGFFNTMQFYAEKTFTDFGNIMNDKIFKPLDRTVEGISEYLPTVGQVYKHSKKTGYAFMNQVANAFKDVGNDIKSKSSGDSSLINSISGRAGGDRYINKTGLYVLSKGEAVIPSNQNPFNPNIATANVAKDAVNEQKIIDAANRAGLGKLSGFAKGTKGARNVAKKEAKKLMKQASAVIDDDDDESPSGVFAAAKQISKWWDAIMNKLPESQRKAIEGFKEQAPEIFGEGALYGGLTGLMLAGGPVGILAGGAIGAGAVMLKNTNRVQEFLYGKENLATGEKEGGFLNKPTVKKMLGFAQDAKSYAIVGGVAGTLTGMGPIPGLIAGSAIAFAKNNKDVREALFGVEGKEKTTMQKFLSEHLGRGLAGVSLGALSGAAIAGPFGAVGGALIGGGLSFMSTTDKFKDAILGPVDPKTGERKGGVLDQLKDHVFNPLKERLESFNDKLEKYMKNQVFDPLSRAFKPLGKLVTHGVSDMFDNISESVKDQFSGSRMKYIFKQLASNKGVKFGAASAAAFAMGIPAPLIPLVGLSGALLNTRPVQRMLNKAISLPKKALSGVMNKIGNFGDKLRTRTIARGMADDMTASERLAHMDLHEQGDYEYRQFDEMLRDGNKEKLQEQLSLLESFQGNQKAFKQQSRAMKNKMYDFTTKSGTTAPTQKLIRRAIDTGKDEDLFKAVKAIEKDPNIKVNAVRTKLIDDLTQQIAEHKEFKDKANDHGAISKEFAEKYGLDVTDKNKTKHAIENLKTELSKRDFENEEQLEPENDPNTVTNVTLASMNDLAGQTVDLLKALVSGKTLTEEQLEKYGDRGKQVNESIEQRQANLESNKAHGDAVADKAVSKAQEEINKEIKKLCVAAGVDVDSLTKQEKQVLSKFCSNFNGLNRDWNAISLGRDFNMGKYRLGDKALLLKLVKQGGDAQKTTKALNKMNNKAGRVTTAGMLEEISKLSSDSSKYARDFANAGMELDNIGAIDNYSNGKYNDMLRMYKRLLNFGFDIKQSGIEMMIDNPKINQRVLDLITKDNTEGVASALENLSIPFKRVPKGGGFFKKLKDKIKGFGSKIGNFFKGAAGIAEYFAPGISSPIKNFKKGFSEAYNATREPQTAAIQKHAFGIGKVLKGGLSALSKGETVISAVNNTLGLTDKLKSAGSMIGKGLKATANFLAPGATRSVADAYDAIKSLSNKAKIDNGGGEISAKVGSNGKKENSTTVSTPYGPQTYKLNTNGTMSLDDTAENKEISRKMEAEVTDRQESKNYLKIIAENTKSLLSGGLFGGGSGANGGKGKDGKDGGFGTGTGMALGGLTAAIVDAIKKALGIDDDDPDKKKTPKQTKEGSFIDRITKSIGDKYRKIRQKARNAGRYTKFYANRFGNSLKTVAGWGGKAIKFGAKGITDLVGGNGTYDAIRGRMSQIGDSITSAPGRFKNWVGDKLTSAKDWTVDKAKSIGSTIAEKATDAKDWVVKGASTIADKAKSMASTVAEKASGAIDSVKGAFGGAAEKAGGFMGDIGAKVKEGATEIQKFLKNLVQKVSTFIPGNLSEKVGKFCTSIIEKINKPEVIKKAMGKAAKQIAAIATGPLGAVIAVGSIAYAFYDGWKNAGGYFQLEEGKDPTTGQKIVAGFTNALATCIPFLGWFIDGGDIIALGKMIFGDNDPASGIADQVQNEIDYVSNQASAAVDWVKQGINNNLEYIGNGIKNNVEYVKNGIANNAEYVVNGIKNNAEYVANGIKNNAQYVANGIANNYQYAKDQIGKGVDYVAQGIQNNVDYVANGIANNFQYVTNKATELGSNLYQGITDTATAVSDTVKQTVTDAQKAIGDTVQSGLDTGKELLNNVWKSAGDMASGLYKSASDLWKSFTDKLPSLKDIKKGAGDLFQQAGSLFQQATQTAKDVGKAAWDTISTGASAVADKVSGAFSSVFGKGKYGRSKYGRGAVLGDGQFASQLDPSNQMSYNASYDSMPQTMADSGCGPGAASNAIAALGGSVPITAAATYALNNGYKEKDGGTKPGFFNSLFNQLGVNSSDISNNKQAIESNLKQGHPVVLMGQDTQVSDKTPYGPGPHYVTATGLDPKGNIIIQDSESDGPNKVYAASDVLSKSSIAIAAKPKVEGQNMAFGMGKFGRSKWGRAKTSLQNIFGRSRRAIGSIWGRGLRRFIPSWGMGKFGRGAGGAGPQLLDMLTQLGFTKIAACGIIGNMMKESTLYSDIIEGGDHGELTSANGNTGYGLCQWTDAGRQQNLIDFAKANGKQTSDAGMQCSFIAKECKEQNIFDAINAATDPVNAAYLFHSEYEKSADNASQIGERGQWAQEAYDNNGAIAGSNGNLNATGIVNSSGSKSGSSAAQSLFGVFDALNDQLDNALNSFGLSKYGRSKYGRGIEDTLSSLTSRFSKAMGPIGKGFQALADSPIGKKMTSLFGENPFSSIIGKAKDAVKGAVGAVTGGSGGQLTTGDAGYLVQNGIDGTGFDPSVITKYESSPGATDLTGVKPAVASKMNGFAKDYMTSTNQKLIVSGGAEKGYHAAGEWGHEGGWKIDISKPADPGLMASLGKKYGVAVGDEDENHYDLAFAKANQGGENISGVIPSPPSGQGKYGMGKFGRAKSFLARSGFYGRAKVLDSIQSNNNAANAIIDASTGAVVQQPVAPIVVQQQPTTVSSNEQKIDTMIQLLSSINNNIALMVQGISAIAQVAGQKPAAPVVVAPNSPAQIASGANDQFDANSMVQIVSDMLKIAKK